MSIRNLWKNARRVSGRSSRIPRLESLEGRELMTAGFTLFPSIASDTAPLHAIVTGSDGNLWVSADSNGIDRITPGGVSTVFPITNPDGSAASIRWLTRGHDGNIWFTAGAFIGSITPSGNVNLIPIPEGNQARAIAADTSGNLWFTDDQNNVEEYHADGTFSVVTLPNHSTNLLVDEIVVTTGGDVWVTFIQLNQQDVSSQTSFDRWHINPIWPYHYNVGVERIARDGAVTSTMVDTKYPDLYSLTIGPDGNVWFVETSESTIGTILPDGSVKTYLVDGTPNAITTGSDGSLWFSLYSSSEFGRLSADGTVSYYAPSHNDATLEYRTRWFDSFYDSNFSSTITTGPDGAIWFTLGCTNAIGRLDVSATPGNDVPLLDTLPPPVPPADPTPIENPPIEDPAPIENPADDPGVVIGGWDIVVSSDKSFAVVPIDAYAPNQEIGVTPGVAPPSHSLPSPVALSNQKQSLNNANTANPNVSFLPVTKTSPKAVVAGPLTHGQARREALAVLLEGRLKARAAYHTFPRIHSHAAEERTAGQEAYRMLRESRAEAVGLLESANGPFQGLTRRRV